MDNHGGLPDSLTTGAVDRSTHETALERARDAERRLLIVTRQLEVLTAVIRLLLDGDQSAAAQTIRTELDAVRATATA